MIKALFVSVFLLARLLPCDGQSANSIFYFDHIPLAGDTLLSQWKFHSGDDSTWASPVYDDKHWKAIDPNMLITDFVKTHPENVGWFRVKIKVSEAFRNKIVGISCNALGATELYLNGKLIRKLGTVDSDPSKLKVIFNVFKPSPALLSNDSLQVLSVRFAYKPNAMYMAAPFKRSVLVAAIGHPELAYGTFYGSGNVVFHYISQLLVGLNFAFFVLHAFMYVYYKRGRFNMYYSLFTLFSALAWLMPVLYDSQHRLEMATMVQLVYNLIRTLIPFYFALTVYSFLGYRKRAIFIILVGVGIITFLLQFYPTDFSFFSGTLPFVLFNIHLCRVAYLARKNGQRGSSFLLLGISASLLLMCLSILLPAITGNVFLFGVLSAIANTAIFIPMSLAIAKRMADTNILLGHKLEEVKSLARDNESILTRQNVLLEEKVAERTISLKQSLLDLKSTQAQLIQSEKMASLGELTAGIAHEIQNPLNFINNFSEVNKEMLEELRAERLKPNAERDESLEANIINDVIDNEQKINHHGKRADAIVKGMLQHSRTNTGQKELIDINALAEEYLRLAYQGQRAKDKSFNATMKTDFDETIGNINIIPQDIGRVVLNLINNAFYAVNEKNASTSSAGQPYEPTVSVSTKRSLSFGEPVPNYREGRGEVIISVKDNGNGIPQKILDKIFQPFFTTKPTGQGTGLGLSLSYDIIKAHGGEIIVETREGEGSEFIIQLPIKTNG